MEEDLIRKVFTPRLEEVNEVMYVSRPELEKQLKRAILGSKHVLVFGESGNGKTWLCKHVLKNNNIPYVITNCGNASRLKSLTTEISNSILGSNTITKTAYTEDKNAKIGVGVASAEVKHQDHYAISSDEPLLEAFKVFSTKYTQSATKALIIDNLESIYKSQELLDELADIILLLDDVRYAKYHIKLIIIGLPADVLEYFQKTKNPESIANRISEITKVDGLNYSQIENILLIGFVKQLGVKFKDNEFKELTNEVYNITMGIAQRVHEFCELLAYEILDNNNQYNKRLLEPVKLAWMLDGLKHAYQVIEGHLNSRTTEITRKNQVIYSIGLLTIHQFDAIKIEQNILVLFSMTVPTTKNMGISNILSQLSKGDQPLLKRNGKTSEYSVLDPKYIMVIRIMLYLNKANQKVIKRQFSR